MKKDRNIQAPYPIYPPYQGINQLPFNMMNPFMQQTCSNMNYNNNNELSILEQKINNLEKRVSTIENMINSSNSVNNSYNSSNYQML